MLDASRCRQSDCGIGYDESVGSYEANTLHGTDGKPGVVGWVREDCRFFGVTGLESCRRERPLQHFLPFLSCITRQQLDGDSQA